VQESKVVHEQVRGEIWRLKCLDSGKDEK